MHAIPGRNPVAEALRSGRRLAEVVVDERGGPDLQALAEQSRTTGVPVRRAGRETLDALSAGVLHQGIVALAEAVVHVPLRRVAARDLVVVLDGISDPQNLGAIARSAEAAGAGGLVLRSRRSAPVTPAAEKASAGALSWLPVAVVPNLVRALADLAELGYWSVGLAGEAAGSLWDSTLLDGKVALVVGAEGRGLSRLVTERVDGLARIPLAGHVRSLNAAAAAAVALFEIGRRRRVGGVGPS